MNLLQRVFPPKKVNKRVDWTQYEVHLLLADANPDQIGGVEVVRRQNGERRYVRVERLRIVHDADTHGKEVYGYGHYVTEQEAIEYFVKVASIRGMPL